MINRTKQTCPFISKVAILATANKVRYSELISMYNSSGIFSGIPCSFPKNSGFPRNSMECCTRNSTEVKTNLEKIPTSPEFQKFTSVDTLDQCLYRIQHNTTLLGVTTGTRVTSFPDNSGPFWNPCPV
jgi:hypothetical protein